MKREYNIKGIDEMIKGLKEKELEQLLKFFNCSITDLEEKILDFLKYKNVPSGLEVALYRESGQEEFKAEGEIIDYEKIFEENQQLKNKYEEFEENVINNEKKALELVELPIGGMVNRPGIYLYIDEPIIYRGDSNKSIGGISYGNHIRCSSKYWEEHQEEIKKLNDAIENIKMEDSTHNRLQTLFKEKERIRNKMNIMDEEIEQILNSFNTRDEIFFRVKDKTRISEIDKIMQEFVREQKEKDDREILEEKE